MRCRSAPRASPSRDSTGAAIGSPPWPPACMRRSSSVSRSCRSAVARGVAEPSRDLRAPLRAIGPPGDGGAAPPRAEHLAQRPALPLPHAGLSRPRHPALSRPRSWRRGWSRSSSPSPARPRARRPPSSRTPGFVIFTSGSTGTPKPGFRSTSRPHSGRSRPSPRPTGSRGARASPPVCRWPPRSGSARTSSCPLISTGMSACSSASTTARCSTSSRRTSTTTGPAPRSMADLLVRAPLGERPGRAPGICHISSGHVAATVYQELPRALRRADPPELRAHRVQLHHLGHLAGGGAPAGDGRLPVSRRGDPLRRDAGGCGAARATGTRLDPLPLAQRRLWVPAACAGADRARRRVERNRGRGHASRPRDASSCWGAWTTASRPAGAIW